MTSIINEWTRALRYRPYDEWPQAYLANLTDIVANSNWQTNYHIQPESGLLNDPNGFSFFNGEWHLFYQFYPFGPVHGLKSWYHLTSKNLVDWKNQGIALEADNNFDSHGVYSGSALPINDELFIAYSGNVRTKDWQRESFQLGAIMDKNNQISKISEPLIPFPIEGYTDHVRDPQLIHYQDRYLIILGAQNNKEEGKILVYDSQDLKKWDFLGELNFSDEEMGFMVECPNLLFIEEQPLLIFCPQGLDKKTVSYQNIYPNMYTIGSTFDLDTLTVNKAQTPRNLDEGFDVYATQAFTDSQGRHLSISWVGLPEIDYPTFKDGWAHCLSLVKELTIKNNKLYQFPVVETKELREESFDLKGELSHTSEIIKKDLKNSYEINLTITKDSAGVLDLLANEDLTKNFEINFDTEKGSLTVNRKNSGESFATEFGNTRSIALEAHKNLELDIFVDESIIEIFINKGEQVITSRVFPNNTQTQATIKGQKGQYFGTMYSLRQMKK